MSSSRFIITTAVSSLQDLARLAIAIHECNHGFQQYQRELNFVVSDERGKNAWHQYYLNWRTVCNKALNNARIVYLHFPAPIIQLIQNTILTIASELEGLPALINKMLYSKTKNNELPKMIWASDVRQKNEKFRRICLNQAYWMTGFKLHRLKMFCALCKECITVNQFNRDKIVEMFWTPVYDYEHIYFRQYFGYYSLNLFCHLISNISGTYFMNYLNTFKCNVDGFRDDQLCTAHGKAVTYVESVYNSFPPNQFFSFIPTEAQKLHAFEMASLILENYHPRIRCFQYQAIRRPTFLFFWEQLDRCDRARIVEANFMDFCEFLAQNLYKRLLFDGIELYSSNNNFKDEQDRLNRVAKKMSTSSDKADNWRKIFHSLFKRIEDMYSEADVIFLLQSLLSQKDTISAVLLLRDMNRRKKRDIFETCRNHYEDWKESIDKDTLFEFFKKVQVSILEDGRL